MKLLTAVLLAATLTVSAAAHAENTCQGKVVIDTVYQKGTNGKFEYFIQARNSTKNPVTFSVEFGQFPTGVSLFSRTLSGVRLMPNQNQQIRFANGSNSTINDGSVKKFYDIRNSMPTPYVLVANCK